MSQVLLETVNSSAHHLNVILVLGIAVFGGTMGAKLFQRLRIPQVVGYIIIGVVLGGSVLDFITPEVARLLSPFNVFALGMIGFMIGGELRYEIFKRYGKQFVIILLSEGLFAFAIVGVGVTLMSWLITGSLTGSLALGLVLGAISSATAPAATVDVLWEYKTRGILTRTILAIVALDDGLALLLYGFASSFAGALLGRANSGWLTSILVPLWEIFGAIVLGAVISLALIGIFRYINERDKLLTFSLSALALTIGLSVVFEVESILAAMVLGASLVNLSPRRSRDAFELVEAFSPPIYVLFFVLVGARLNVTSLPLWVMSLAVVYVIGRSSGKILGSWFGAKVAKAPAAVRKYLGICLFSQAGVAVGLSLLASQRFSESIGEAIILIVTTTTFLVQVIGPVLVKVGVTKAGEVGLNITEEDLVQTHTVGDVMDTGVPILSAGTPLRDVIELVAQTRAAFYPVVEPDRGVIGSITLEGIRAVFATQELNGWLIAMDIMDPVTAVVPATMVLSEALEKAQELDVEQFAVVDAQDIRLCVGIMDTRSVHRRLAAETLARQKEADALSELSVGPQSMENETGPSPQIDN